MVVARWPIVIGVVVAIEIVVVFEVLLAIVIVVRSGCRARWSAKL